MTLFRHAWHWTRRQEPVVLCSLLVLAALGWAFFEIADKVVEGRTREFETRILRGLRDPADPAKPWGPRWLAQAATEWTALGAWPILSIIVLSASGYLFISRRRITGALVLASVAGAMILSILLKNHFGRARPDLVPALTEELTPSFPSGHSLTAAAVYLTLGATLATAARRARERAYILGAAVFVTVLVGLTRMYLGVHFPTDVLGGWCVGSAWALVCWLIARRVQRRRLVVKA